MSTSKTLSTGTLSLRFMQNAQRAKQQAAVDLERAKVKDEAEWELPKEVREALGLASSSKVKTEQTIVQESSYLPFLFPSLRNGGLSSNDEAADEVATSTKIAGRRTFAKGRETLATSSSKDGPTNDEEDTNSDTKQETNATEPSAFELSKPSEGSTGRKRPRMVGPLTGKRTAARLAGLGRTNGLPKQEYHSDVPVLSMISEETSVTVGMDIRQMRKLKGKEKERISALTGLDEVAKLSVMKPEPEAEKTVTNGAGKSPLSFLRPTGVDSPAQSSSSGKKSKRRVDERDEEATGAILELSRRKADSNPISADVVADLQDPPRQATKNKKQKQVKVES